MMQVYYNGGAHCLDPHMNFYCYDRSSPPQIASVQQLQDDPTLARRAVEGGRAGQGYLLCGDSPDWFAGAEGDWHLEADGDWPSMQVDEPFGRIELRSGERYVRTWQPGPHFYRAGWLKRDDTGPIHHCAENDRTDVTNWPLYEPHGWKRNNGRTYYRVWGSGQLEYIPRFDEESWCNTMIEGENWQIEKRAGGIVLAQVDHSRPAEVVIPVACPYVLTAGSLDLLLDEWGEISAWVQVNDEHTLAPVEEDRTIPPLAHRYTRIPLAAHQGQLTGTFIEEINGCLEGYLLKIVLRHGATVRSIALTSHFQLNRYSLPFLVPGKNRVQVEAASFGRSLTVE
jgi:hypothetical protein